MCQLLAALRRRLQRKIVAVAPMITGALLVVVIVAAAISAIEPYLPPTFQQLLHQMRHGEWTASRNSLLSMFDAAGDSRPSLFLLLQVVQVLVAPVPGHMLALLGGALFGFWQGLWLAMLGLVIGSALAMGGSRVLGETLVRRFVPAPILARFDHLAGESGMWSFFLIFLLPAFPDDAICFMAGLTRFPLPRLLLVSTLGRLPGTALLCFVGAGVEGSTAPTYLVLGVATVLAIGLWLFSEEIEALVWRFGKGHGDNPGS